MLRTLDGIRSPLDGFPSPLAARRGGGGFSTAAYAANSINPELVADFVSDFYAQDGAASTFADLFYLLSGRRRPPTLTAAVSCKPHRPALPAPATTSGTAPHG
jgi:hypothetical protein